jgi:HAD superfamily phosphatase (TIGR01668 family)
MRYKNPIKFLKSEINLGAFNPRLWTPKSLQPSLIIKNFESLEVAELRTRGIEGLAVDYDGVIAAYHSLDMPDISAIRKINELKDTFKVCILSNRRFELLDSLREALPDFAIIRSKNMKPNPEPYIAAMDHLQLPPQKTALIEDRLLTGVSGGNLAGMHTVWVEQPRIKGKEPLSVRIYRWIEKSILAFYVKIGLTQQNKHSIRGENELLVDLHFHLGKQKSLKGTIAMLAETVDVVCITGRGHRFSNDFEYDFDSFCNQLKEENIEFSPIGKVGIVIPDKGNTLYVTKAQEIHTSEGYDIVVVGSNEDLKDYISYKSVIRASRNAISILSTPSVVPNTIHVRRINDPLIKEVALCMDCVESHNQNLFLGNSNQYAKELANLLSKPAIAVSDSHRYSRNIPLNVSGIIVPCDCLDFSSDEILITSLKDMILANRFYNHEICTPIATVLDLLSLRPRQIYQLFFGTQ